MKKPILLVLLLFVCLSNSARINAADNRVTAGEFIVDPPTLINLGFEWFIQGDDNRNAAVEVRFRKMEDSVWRNAQPLLRLQGEEIYNGAHGACQ